jgi:hypothetical protein
MYGSLGLPEVVLMFTVFGVAAFLLVRWLGRRP